MAENITAQSYCEVCGIDVDSQTNLRRFGKLFCSVGPSAEELHQVAEYMKNGTLKDMLTVAEIALRRLDPEKMSTEFQVNNAMSKLREVSDTNIKEYVSLYD